MKLIVKIIVGIGVTFLSGIIVLKISSNNTTEAQYDTEDLINNYELKSSEIFELKDYIREITPQNYSVYVEFNSEDEIDLNVWEKSDTLKDGRLLWFREWNINPYNYKQKERSDYDKKYGGKTNSLEEVARKLKWQDDEFKKIKIKLDKANCISIAKSDNIYSIGFQRSGMGKYHYKIFDDLPNKEIKEKYNDGCMYKYFKDNIVLEYGGGAVGMQCFEESNVRNE